MVVFIIIPYTWQECLGTAELWMIFSSVFPSSDYQYSCVFPAVKVKIASSYF